MLISMLKERHIFTFPRGQGGLNKYLYEERGKHKGNEIGGEKGRDLPHSREVTIAPNCLLHHNIAGKCDSKQQDIIQ